MSQNIPPFNKEDGRQINFDLADDGSVSDFEREEIASDISEPFDPNDIDIKTRQFTVGQVLDRIQHKEILLTPDFQREAGIWKPREKSRLIESLLLRIPLPMFYIATDKDDNWVVVDGLQRLTTIKDFVLGGNTGEKFVLSDLEFLTDFNGKKFELLPRSMQRRLRETELVMHIIQPSTPSSVTRTIFRRINTGGLPLSAQEIRHALYQGKSTKLLKELVRHRAYLEATDWSLKDDRMAGRESILRFLAFYRTPPDKYTKKDLDGFLSRGMEEINALSDEAIEELKSVFEVSMKRNRVLFRQYAFRKQFKVDAWRYPLNKALFETWAVALAKLQESEFQILRDRNELLVRRFCELMLGQWLPEEMRKERAVSFEYSVSQDTSDPVKVRFRFKAVEGLIEAVISGSAAHDAAN